MRPAIVSGIVPVSNPLFLCPVTFLLSISLSSLSAFYPLVLTIRVLLPPINHRLLLFSIPSVLTYLIIDFTH